MTEYWVLNCTGTDTSIAMFTCYLSVGTRCRLLISQLLTQILSKDGMDSIFLCRDFNASIWKVNDYNYEFDEILSRKGIDEVL